MPGGGSSDNGNDNKVVARCDDEILITFKLTCTLIIETLTGKFTQMQKWFLQVIPLGIPLGSTLQLAQSIQLLTLPWKSQGIREAAGGETTSLCPGHNSK